MSANEAGTQGGGDGWIDKGSCRRRFLPRSRPKLKLFQGSVCLLPDCRSGFSWPGVSVSVDGCIYIAVVRYRNRYRPSVRVTEAL